jgi:hypothetical protein
MYSFASIVENQQIEHFKMIDIEIYYMQKKFVQIIFKLTHVMGMMPFFWVNFVI